MNNTLSAFEQALRSHDECIKRRDLAIWIGVEPTFTDRRSEAPEWLCNALGPTKELHAQQMLAETLRLTPGAAVLRTLGRQYSKEDLPRWSLGIYRRRDGQPIWSGPSDPLTTDSAFTLSTKQLEDFWEQLAQRLDVRGWPALLLTVETFPHLRVVFRCDTLPLMANPEHDTRLARPSLHGQPIPLQGPRDELAEQGIFLLGISNATLEQRVDDQVAPCVELPACPDVGLFLSLLEAISEAANIVGLPSLTLTGFPPPVDASVAWTTLTPDPAVVEANMAPALDAATFLQETQACFSAAAVAGLSPYRLHYNGQITDSGGGGQITLGGPTPDRSPFLAHPHLLPALIAYFNRHPALSFYFAGDFIGSSSQAPRADERTTDLFEELTLALALLGRQRNPTPDLLWQTLSPFLADPAGNPHRAEINIEKLWNPYLPGRGQLGLVEFRAFRMPPTPERLTALATLLRAIVAMLIQSWEAPRLIDWGRELHDRFALPFYLRTDLWEVLDELARAGLGLGQPLIAELLDEQHYLIGEAVFGDCQLTVRRALEFWPLLGDALSQEHGHSRWVDASTTRLEISLRAQPGAPQGALHEWQLTTNGYRLPMRREDELDGETWLCGLRYRRFKPWTGLHPGLEAHGPLQLVLSHPQYPGALKVTLHEWRPQGGGYDGLPNDFETAAARRAERFVAEYLDDVQAEPPLEPQHEALTPYTFDLRWL
ncbi:MAG: transglutaminase family protein [Candidatus Competibacteraceae bacterium]|nr:transglutaminase family protein [Candidatus Competibacteraceae bacterium]